MPLRVIVGSVILPSLMIAALRGCTQINFNPESLKGHRYGACRPSDPSLYTLGSVMNGLVQAQVIITNRIGVRMPERV